MKKIKNIILILGLVVAIPLSSAILFPGDSAYAKDCKDAAGNAIPNCCLDSDNQEVMTSVLSCPSGTEGRELIWQLLTIGVNFLAIGVGLAVVAGIVFGAFTYASAAGSADQAKKGISYITNAVIGLLLFIFMYAIINFLVPGGVL